MQSGLLMSRSLDNLALVAILSKEDEDLEAGSSGSCSEESEEEQEE